MQRTNTALKDALPAYIYRPFNFVYDPRKTVADGSDISNEEEQVEQKPTQPIQPLAQQSSGQLNTTDALYSNYTPLIDSMNKHDELSKEGKAALLGQFINESGWQTKALTRGYNYGNIIAGSAWDGKIMQRGDHDAEGNPILQNFRVYGSTDEFFNDYLDLIKSSYPQAYAALVAPTFSIETFTDGLTSGKRKYATNPAYKSLVTKMYNKVIKDLLT